MKTNIMCPVSTERIPVNIPRVTAFFVVAVLVVAVLAQLYFLTGLLAIDFFIRGFLHAKISPIGRLSQIVSRFLKLNGALIDKAPKVFAAKLGFVFSTSIFLLSLIGWDWLALYFAAGLAVFATLECVFNVCVGCYVYSWIVFPWALKKG